MGGARTEGTATDEKCKGERVEGKKRGREKECEEPPPPRPAFLLCRSGLFVLLACRHRSLLSQGNHTAKEWGAAGEERTRLPFFLSARERVFFVLLPPVRKKKRPVVSQRGQLEILSRYVFCTPSLRRSRGREVGKIERIGDGEKTCKPLFLEHSRSIIVSLFSSLHLGPPPPFVFFAARSTRPSYNFFHSCCGLF